MPAKTRLDELLVARGLSASRSQAKALIMSGRVRHGTERLDKPGKEYPADFAIIVDQPPRFVGRGGDKLASYLEKFPLVLTEAHLLDVGASTGGFTDCALQAGAASATCVDVGHSQLHDKLRRLFNKPYIVEKPVLDSIAEIIRCLEAGQHVVLSFGDHESDLAHNVQER